MPTTRYSSLWDRLRRDNASLSEANWDAWLATNYPEAVARTALGGYVSEHGNPRAWGICPATLAEIAWLFFRNVLTAAQARAVFSLSDHEAAQMGDVVAWVQAAGNSTAQMLRWRDFACLMDMVEQRGITSKSYIYTLMSIRADSANG